MALFEYVCLDCGERWISPHDFEICEYCKSGNIVIISRREKDGANKTSER